MTSAREEAERIMREDGHVWQRSTDMFACLRIAEAAYRRGEDSMRERAAVKTVRVVEGWHDERAMSVPGKEDYPTIGDLKIRLNKTIRALPGDAT